MISKEKKCTSFTNYIIFHFTNSIIKILHFDSSNPINLKKVKRSLQFTHYSPKYTSNPPGSLSRTKWHYSANNSQLLSPSRTSLLSPTPWRGSRLPLNDRKPCKAPIQKKQEKKNLAHRGSRHTRRLIYRSEQVQTSAENTRRSLPQKSPDKICRGFREPATSGRFRVARHGQSPGVPARLYCARSPGNLKFSVRTR